MQIIRCRSREELDRLAAEAGASKIRAALQKNAEVTVIVATGMSQAGMLENLAAATRVDWARVTGFHLDEYIGLPATHVASFRRYLKERFVDLVPVKTFHFINGEADPESECRRVGDLISRRTVDVAFVGIGENGHLAFNDPPADFDVQAPYAIVDLAEASRRQQVGEGWFAKIDDVPRRAISMSIAQMMKAKEIICSAPDARKAKAVQAVVEGPLSPQVPASILQRHPSAQVFVDRESGSLLRPA